MTGGSPRSWAASRDFIMIHLDLLDAVDGSYPAAAVWSRILYRGGRNGWWAASRSEMAADTRLTEAVLRRALTELRDAGLVESERVSPFDPTQKWRILWEGAEDDRDRLTDDETGPQEDLPRDGGILQHEREESSVTVLEESSSTPSSKNVRTTPPPPEGEPALFDAGASPVAALADADPLRGFDAWYRDYPRKIAKGDARKAWQQVLRAGADPEMIRAGLMAQVETLREQHARGFCPYPASWLRAERWEDAPDNVHHLRPSVPAPTEAYDPAAAAALPPPPRKDLFG